MGDHGGQTAARRAGGQVKIRKQRRGCRQPGTHKLAARESARCRPHSRKLPTPERAHRKTKPCSQRRITSTTSVDVGSSDPQAARSTSPTTEPGSCSPAGSVAVEGAGSVGGVGGGISSDIAIAALSTSKGDRNRITEARA